MLTTALIVLRWVLTPLRWLRKVWIMFREIQTREQAILSVRDLTARELRSNASAVENYEKKLWSIGNVQEQLQFGKWDGHAAEWAALRRRNQALWHEVADAYEALRKTQGVGAVPPNSADLFDLARRLEEAKL